MQIKSLRIKSYRSWCIDDRPVDDIAKQRLKLLEKYWALRTEGCSEKTSLETIEVKRSTLFRWQAAYRTHGLPGLTPKPTTPKVKRQPQWSKQLEQQVLHLRKRYPLWGKKTISVLLNRDRQLPVSESTVGRILKKLLLLGRIKPVCFYYQRTKNNRPRVFNKHAKRWKKGMRAKRPGELIQIDHMTVHFAPGKSVKHFEATCPITKITVSQAYCGASSRTAADFLKIVQSKLPFEIISIQVDGGSEFRKDFESACEQQAIPLFVLPPRSPELNGCVERCNRTIRYEFYRLYDGATSLSAVREALAGYMKLYNTFRPHQALNMATPVEYYHKTFLEAA